MNPNTILSRNAHLISVNNGGKIYLMDTTNDKYYNLGEVGGRIWELLDQPTSVSDLVKKLTEEYDVSAEQCMADTTPFLQMLISRGMLECR